MFKKLKKATALMLAAVMVLSLAACGGNVGKEPDQETNGANTEEKQEKQDAAANMKEGEGAAPAASGKKRVIQVGTWYDRYYTSDHTKIEDDPALNDEEAATMRLENIRAVEEKYNIELHFVNLTWDGTIDSINTSIMAGTPDCDIYEVDMQFGIPAALNGYAMDLKDFLPADSDIFNDQEVMTYLDIESLGGTYLFRPYTAENGLGAYPLGFNMDMISAAGLENPQDVYDRGEWTWDKFLEYCQALTKDTDGDGATDVYGFGSPTVQCFSNLLMSNGAAVAAGPTQTLDDPKTIEVMQFIYDLWNTYNVARPYDTVDYWANMTVGADGLIAFFPVAGWLSDSYLQDITFELGVVPWPCGPSGNKDTNAMSDLSGNAYFIPVGCEDPELVYNVFYDWTNWYQNDTDLRDDTEWFENTMKTERNFEYLELCGTKPGFDIWNTLSVANFGIEQLMGAGGENHDEVKTPSQMAEEFKQLFQDALDAYFQ